MKVSVIVEGASRLDGSYGYVNVHLAAALANTGLDVLLAPWDQTEACCRAELSAVPGLDKLRVSNAPDITAEVRIRQIWPPVWRRADDGSRLVVIQPWEFGSLPIAWLEGVAEADAVLVPSNAVKAGYCQSGIPSEKVWVVPNGTDLGCHQEQLHPRGRGDLFELLFLGGGIYRKGIDLLIETLAQLPRTTLARIHLTIKETGVGTYYKGLSLVEQSLAAAPEVAACSRVVHEHLTRQEVAHLFDNADLLVHPYRAEGFGLPVLEAMASGLPVLVTGGGATDDFCGPREGYQIASELTVSSVPLVGDLLTYDFPYHRTPSVADLAERLEALVSAELDLGGIQAAAWERAQSYRWVNVATLVLQVLAGFGQGTTPGDQFTEAGISVAGFLTNPGQANWITPTRSLLTVGDIVSAVRLLEVAGVHQSGDLRIASTLYRLRRQASARPDIWSGAPWRLDLAARRSEEGKFPTIVHRFEGDDKATVRIAGSIAPYFAGCRRVLDLGCGQGSMLRTLRSLGKEVAGIEGDPVLVDRLRREGFRIHQGWIPEALDELADERFDGVFMGHIVEHLPTDKALSVFHWVAAHLEDGGALVVQTPDFSVDFVTRTNFWLNPTHIRPYPVALLKGMLESAGFSPLLGGCRSLAPVAPLDVIAVGRRRNWVPGQPSESDPVTACRRLLHFGLFSSLSGVGHASRNLLDEPALVREGFELVRIDVAPTGGTLSLPSTLSFDESIGLDGDVAIIDVPAGWLPEVLPNIRAERRVVRLFYEATPLPRYLVEALRGVDEIWAASRYSLESAAAGGVPRERLHLISPHISPLTDTPRLSPRRRVEVLGSIFNFEPRKNPEALLEAFAELLARDHALTLLLKTSGITRSDFWIWATGLLGSARADRVRAACELIVEPLTDVEVSALLARCDLFVLPTRGEGFGLPFLEAMALGIPVVCPDVGGHRDFCDETTSFLVSSRTVPCQAAWGIPLFRESYWHEVDREALAASIASAVNDPKLVSRKGKASRTRATEFAAVDRQAQASARLAALCDQRQSLKSSTSTRDLSAAI